MDSAALSALREHQERLAAAEKGPTFKGLPDRWYDDPTWRCTSGHVSKRYLKSEALGGSVCLACCEPIVLTAPEDVDVPPPGVPHLGEALALSRLILKFGQTYRATQDGEGRPESDTTHSLMLALLVGSMAPYEAVPLDRGLVVMLALVHDLPEALAGDTSTLRQLSAEEQAEKDAREAAAVVQLREDLAGLPWILDLLDIYERQDTPEARFVKYVDKILPKLSHRDNRCKVPREQGMDLAEFVARHRQQGTELAARFPEMSLARSLFAAACLDAETQYPAESLSPESSLVLDESHHLDRFLNGLVERATRKTLELRREHPRETDEQITRRVVAAWQEE